jgi:hypothetical protein
MKRADYSVVVRACVVWWGWSGSQSTHRGRVEIGGSVPAVSAGAYTTTFRVIQ